MDIASHTLLDCQQDDNSTVSLVERRSSFAECSSSDNNSSIIHIENTNPASKWQLPTILTKDVYKLSFWEYIACTHIKVSSVDIFFTDSEELVHINLLEKRQID